MVIAGRMHGIGVLIHEFAHYRFDANKKRSDWIGDLFLAWPIFATVDAYRQNHLAHHQHTNTEKDPDWVIKLHADEFTFPQTRLKMLLNFLGYLVGISSYRDIKSVQARVGGDRNTSKGYELARFGFLYLLCTVFCRNRILGRIPALLGGALCYDLLLLSLCAQRGRAFRQHGLQPRAGKFPPY